MQDILQWGMALKCGLPQVRSRSWPLQQPIYNLVAVTDRNSKCPGSFWELSIAPVNKTWDVAELAECFLSTHKALSSVLSRA